MSRMFGPFSLPRMALATIVAAALMVGATSALASAPNPMTKVPQGVNPAKLAGLLGVWRYAGQHPRDRLVRAQGAKPSPAARQRAGWPQAVPHRPPVRRHVWPEPGHDQCARELPGAVRDRDAGVLRQPRRGRQWHRGRVRPCARCHAAAVPRTGVHGRGGLRGVPTQTVHGSAQSPELPASLAQAVLAIFGRPTTSRCPVRPCTQTQRSSAHRPAASRAVSRSPGSPRRATRRPTSPRTMA